MKLYGLKNCDSCKKALREIKNAGKNVEFIDIRNNSISLEIIKSWLAQHGDAMLVNRKSTTWRNLDEESRKMPASLLLQAHPTLVKRPVIVNANRSYVGWTTDVKYSLGIA